MFDIGSRTSCEYDERGNLSVVRVDLHTDAEIDVESLHAYDSRDRLVSTTTMRSVGGQAYRTRTTYEYDDTGNCVAASRDVDFDGEVDRRLEFTYSDDSSSSVATSESGPSFAVIDAGLISVEVDFDRDGATDEVIELVDSGEGRGLDVPQAGTSQIAISYRQVDGSRDIRVEIDNSADGTTEFTFCLSYGSDGRRTGEAFAPSGADHSGYRLVFTYDQDGNPTAAIQGDVDAGVDDPNQQRDSRCW